MFQSLFQYLNCPAMTQLRGYGPLHLTGQIHVCNYAGEL